MKTINTYIKSRKGYRLKRPKKNHNSKPAMKIQINYKILAVNLIKFFRKHSEKGKYV